MSPIQMPDEQFEAIKELGRQEARADADREVERLREALLSRIVDIRWAGARDPSDYWRGFNDALDKCETEIEAALLTQQPKP